MSIVRGIAECVGWCVLAAVAYVLLLLLADCVLILVAWFVRGVVRRQFLRLWRIGFYPVPWDWSMPESLTTTDHREWKHKWNRFYWRR